MKNLVLVEDDECLVVLVVEYFECNGFNVLRLVCGEGFVELVKIVILDIVIFDVMLLGEDGFVLCS